MVLTGQVINVGLLLILLGLTWWIPRRMGILGVFVVRMLVALGFIVMGGVALLAGIWPSYDDGLVIVGLLLQAFVLNCVLLPIAGVAVWRHWRAEQASH